MTDVREIERRKLNITEGLILASLLGLGALIFRLNDSVTRLQVEAAVTNKLLADVPAISQRLARAEVQIDANKQAIEELRDMRGLK